MLKLLAAIRIGCAAVAVLSIVVGAQTASTDLKFEIVSIKRNTTGTLGSNVVERPDGRGRVAARPIGR